jgi:hypothetical protein
LENDLTQSILGVMNSFGKEVYILISIIFGIYLKLEYSSFLNASNK